MTIWGNHSTTQVPDFVNAKIGGKRVPAVVKDVQWLKEEFTPKVANRGGALIKKWGRSSAASTAVSIADHLRSLYTPTPPGDCFSTGVYTEGNPYGVDGVCLPACSHLPVQPPWNSCILTHFSFPAPAEDLIFSMPCRSDGDGDYEIIDDFVIDDWLQAKIKVRWAVGGACVWCVCVCVCGRGGGALRGMCGRVICAAV